MNRYGIRNICEKALDKITQWREKSTAENYFILIISFVIGITTAIVGVILKKIIELIEHHVLHHVGSWNYWYLVLPAIGVLISGIFIKYIINDDIGHGVSKVLYAISQKKGRIKRHNVFSSIIASAITIGFGGSVGAESPIVMTGAAVGSNIGRIFKLEHRNLILLIGCGVAGALSGIFKAPITGMIFVIEVLMLDLTMASVLPLLVSSVTSASLSYIIGGRGSLFDFNFNEPYKLDNIPFMIVLGISCGFMALFFSKTMFSLEGWLKKIRKYRHKYIISVSILSILIFIFPPLYGEGYSTINELLGGKYGGILDGTLLESFSGNFWIMFSFLLFTVLVKVFASVTTTSAGGCGGLFAPTLFVGALTGFLYSTFVNYLPLNAFLSNKNYILLGMSGLMAAVMHAPLTGIFLVAELSGGYGLFLPLMLVSLSAYATIRVFMPHSIYSLRLAEEGKLLTHHKDNAVLTLMNIENVLETDFMKMTEDMNLGDMVKVISKSTRNSFPVVSKEGKLTGIVTLDDIRSIMFSPELYERYNAKKLMVFPENKINATSMQMTEIMQLFDKTKAWILPVVDNDGKYLGFVSKSKIFNTYRNILNDIFIGD